MWRHNDIVVEFNEMSLLYELASVAESAVDAWLDDIIACRRHTQKCSCHSTALLPREALGIYS